MNTFAFLLLLLAAFTFVIESVRQRSLVALGLCLLTIGLIVEFGAKAQSLHF